MVEFSRISLARLTWLVARDVNRTLGGGYASMELLRRTFIANGGLSDEGNAMLLAVSRLTPGTNVLAYCAALGWSLNRWPGCLASVVAASVPGSVLVFALAAALVTLHELAAVRLVLAVGVIAATFLVLASAWYLLRPYLTRTAIGRTVGVAIAAAALLAAGATPVRILLVAALVGAFWGGPTRTAAVE